MATIYWKKGETKQKLIVKIVDRNGNVPDFADVSTVTFKFKETGETLISKTGAVEDADEGELSWTPAADESDYGTISGKIDAATYSLEVKVVWTDNRESIYPIVGTATVIVADVLA